VVRQVQQRHALSQRRACQALGWSRASTRYRPRLAKQAADQALTDTLRDIAARHPRYGYRRAHAVLQRSRSTNSPVPPRINHKRVQRVWQAAGLSLPRRRPKRRAKSHVAPRQDVTRPNQVWCYDFVHDRCANGAVLKLLTIEDEFTRESLAIEVGGSIPATRVLHVLDRLFAERGAPEGIRSDNGPEFIAHQVKQHLQQQEVQTHYIDPGKPWQNGLAESFHGKLRDECLNREWFCNRAEATAILRSYQRYYNDERPHSSLGYITPSEFRQAYEARRTTDQPNP
jgi:putative transposase